MPSVGLPETLLDHLDVSPTGTWYFQVTAYNNRFPAQTAEGPF